MTLVDPTGDLLTTIRSDPTVAGMTTKVRSPEPDPGDALGPGSYQRFIVLVRLGYTRLKRMPMQEVRYAARCYGQGTNPARDAATLAGAVSDAIHAKGPHIHGTVGVYATFDDGGGEGAAEDPDTHQPYETVIIQVVAADRPIG